MKKKYDILTVFDMCVDIVFTGENVVPEFSQKEKLVDDYMIELGGSAGIFACQCAKLGLATTGKGVTGNDTFGELLLRKMAENGIDTTNIDISDEMKTGACIALIHGSDRAILTYNGTIDAVTPDMLTDELLSQTRHLHIASYFLTNQITPSYPEIIQRAKVFGATVSLDTNWDPDEKWDSGLKDVLPMVDIFMPNTNEIRYISGKESLEDAVAYFRSFIPVIALKMGGDGARVISKETDLYQRGRSDNIVDTVGAGDSFDAGFLYGYLTGRDLKTCLDIASYCGTSNVTAQGGIAGQPKKADVETYLSRK